MAARQFYTNTADTETSDTAADYSKQQVTLTFTPDASATYYIIGSWEMQQLTSTIRYIAGRIRDVTDNVVYQEYIRECNDTTEDYYSNLGLGIYTAGASPSSTEFAIEYKGENTAVTAKCRNARLTAIKAAAADQSAETTTQSTHTGDSNFTDYTTLTFTPGSAGDYLIIAAMQLDLTSGSNLEAQGQIDVDGTAYGTAKPGINVTSTNKNPFMCVKKVTLTAASHTIKLQFATTNAAATVTANNGRILALRWDAFDNAYYVDSETRTTTTSTTYVDSAATLTQTPAAVNHLMLASAVLDNNSTLTDEYCTFLDGATTKGEDKTEPRLIGNTYPVGWSYVATLAGTSETWKLQYRRESTNTVGINHMAIAVIQLDASSAPAFMPEANKPILQAVNRAAVW